MKPLLTFLGILGACALFIWWQAAPGALAVSQSPPSERDRGIMAVCNRVNAYAAYVVEARHSAIPRSHVLALLEETTGPDHTPHPEKWRQFMRWIVNYIYQDPAFDASWIGIQIDMKCIEFAVRAGY